MKKIFVVIALSSVMFACNNKAKEEAALKQQQAEKELAVKAVKDSLRLDSFKKAEIVKKEQAAEAQRQAELAAARKAGARSSRSYASSGSSTSSSYGGTQPTAKKKGRGAIIGGLAGAGGGYLIGRGEDRKSGRVQPKN